MHSSSNANAPDIALMETLEPRLLLDVASVLVGAGGNASLSFTDGDGSDVRFAVDRGGSADVQVEADGAVNVVVDGKGRATATGTNLRLTTIDVLQSTGQSHLQFSVRGGDGTATLGEIDAAGMDLGDVRGADILLEDGAGITADSTRSIELGGASDTAINVADTGDLCLGPVDALTLNATTGGNWLFSADVVDTDITVGTVGALQFRGMVDPSNVQVLIEARFVEFREDLIETDIDFNFVRRSVRFGGSVTDGTVGLGDVNGVVQFDRQVSNTPITINQAGRGVKFDGLLNSDATINFARSISGDWISGGVHAFGAVEISTVLRALQNNAQVNILSSPKVTVQNSQNADIDVIDARRFVAGEEFQDTGVTLTVVPTVNADNFINVDLDITRANVVNVRGDVTGGTVTVTDEIETAFLVNGSVTGSVFDMNIVNSLDLKRDVVNTNITVQDGGKIVIGGLRRSVVENSDVTVPLLGKLRVLGRLFRNNTIETQRALHIFIAPRIINSSIDPISLGSLILPGGMENSVAVSDTFTDKIQVGDMVDSVIYSGVDLGPDGLFNSGDETWKPGNIADFALHGQISGTSLVGVGVDPGPDGLFFTGDDVGLGGGILSTRFGSYVGGGGGAPADAYGLIAAESIAPFRSNGNAIAATQGNPFVDGDFNVAVTGV